MKKFLGLITRCKDEFFIKEFVEYYLNEGIDHVYVIDDDSYNKDIYRDLLFYKNVSVLFEKNPKDEGYEANRLYRRIKLEYEWIIFLDVDEFIVPKKNPFNTLREELIESFSQYDCVKIPWVMMSSGGRDENPVSVLRENIWRWNHDARHPHTVRKFRCRYDQIEVKCIFRPEKFKAFGMHFPTNALCDVSVVDSVRREQACLNHFYDDFRESDIKVAHLVCYHHRMISKENSLNKIRHSAWYHDFAIDELLNGDYAEVLDNTLSVRQFRKKVFIIGFDHAGGEELHEFFKGNGLASICWDDNSLVQTMLLNRESGNKLLSSGEVLNTQVNSDVPLEKVQVVSNMTWSEKGLDAKDFYKDLDRQYPNSKFILNVCDVESWVKARKQYNDGEIVEAQKRHYGVEEGELEVIWKILWARTLSEMTEYFENRDNFTVFDVTKNTVNELQEFFKGDVLFNPDITLRKVRNVRTV